MRESLVSLCRAVHLFLAFDGRAGIIVSVDYLSGKLFLHGFLAAVARKAYHPTDSQRLTALGTDFHRDLIGRAAYAASLYLKHRLDVFQRRNENFLRRAARLFTDDFKSVIHYALSNALFAVLHNLVSKLGDNLTVIHRIRKHVALRNPASSWHNSFLL